MSADPRRKDLDAAVLRWMREVAADPVEAWPRDDDRFDTLALQTFDYQFRNCEAYARYCEAIGLTDPREWREIPAVPAGAFKEMRLASFDVSSTAKIFRTSGTSSGRRGELHLDRLELYEASLQPSLEHLLFADCAAPSRLRMRILAASKAESPESSLSHMFEYLLAARGDDQSGFDVLDGALRSEMVLKSLKTARSEAVPIALIGTAFAFVHLLDALDERGIDQLPLLPAGSRAMETGGFKGRSREVSREALHAEMSTRLGFGPGRIINQYGMTELGSQFYDSLLVDPEGPVRKLGPPWARVRIVSPETGDEVPVGEVGMISIFDLANTGSVSAISTADLGREVAAPGSAHGSGFEVLGRQAGAEERGCSIAADLMLGEA